MDPLANMDPLAIIGSVAAIFQLIHTATKLVQAVKRFQLESSHISGEWVELERLRLVCQEHLASRMFRKDALALQTSALPDEVSNDVLTYLNQTKSLADGIQARIEQTEWLPQDSTLRSRVKWAIKGSQRRNLEETTAELETLRLATQTCLLRLTARDTGLGTSDSLMESSLLFQRLDQSSRVVMSALVDELQANLSDEQLTFQESTAIRHLLDIRRDSSEPVPGSEDDLRNEASQAVLQRLPYEVMDRRSESIVHAAANSCDWIWDQEPDADYRDLTDWLVCGTGIYLIAGNEGSGKSTLLKHLFNHTRTLTLLNQWADSDSVPLATAAFFFWRPGTQLQRSEEGLLRSILYSILKQQPQIIPIVFPNIYARLYAILSAGSLRGKEGGGWNSKGLRAAFARLIRQTHSPLKLFFMIDGIDEYQDPRRDMRTMISFFPEEISKSTNAKAIIASRQLEDMDELGIKPSLKLHRFNHGAILTYVTQALAQQQSSVDKVKLPDSISHEISSSAQGSFLWAHLAVRRVSELLYEGENLQNIEELLKKSSPELHDLYDYMWSSIPSDRASQASEILQIMAVGTSSCIQFPGKDVSLADLAFAQGEPNEAIESKIRECEEREIAEKCSQVSRLIRLICPGFLHMSTNSEQDVKSDARVQYCHRSVEEYFVKDDTQKMLRNALDGQPFDPYLAHLKSSIHQLKVFRVSQIDKPEYASPFWKLAVRALLSAHRVESKHPTGSCFWNTGQRLVKELNSTMEFHAPKLREKEKKGTKDNRTTLKDEQDNYEISDHGRRMKHVDSLSWVNWFPGHSPLGCDRDSFESLTIQFGLKGCLGGSAKSNKTVRKSKKGRPLLDYALHPSAYAAYDLITPDIVRTLLDCGADPNKKFKISIDGKTKKVTCWDHALMWQYQKFRVEGAKQFRSTTMDTQELAETRLQIVKLLLQRGARTESGILTSLGDIVSSRDALEESFKGWVNDDNLKEILKLCDESRSVRPWTRWPGSVIGALGIAR